MFLYKCFLYYLIINISVDVLFFQIVNALSLETVSNFELSSFFVLFPKKIICLLFIWWYLNNSTFVL